MSDWNSRYVIDSEYWLKRQVNPMLAEWAHLLPKDGLVLDAAAGVGVNSMFVARRGLRVVGMDISEVALGLGMNRAREDGLSVQGIVYDLSGLNVVAESFDVILNFFFLERSTLYAYRQALKSGGLLYFETLLKIGENKEYPEYYLEQGELNSSFSDYELLHWDRLVDSGENKCSERMIVRKPTMASE